MFYRMVVRLAMMYRIECFAVKKQLTQKISMVEMEMLRRMSGVSQKDQLRDEFI